ncbi:hypothetical protein MTO96_036750, partial [Rhipicephalus appendiculatus]
QSPQEQRTCPPGTAEEEAGSERGVKSPGPFAQWEEKTEGLVSCPGPDVSWRG